MLLSNLGSIQNANLCLLSMLRVVKHHDRPPDLFELVQVDLVQEVLLFEVPVGKVEANKLDPWHSPGPKMALGTPHRSVDCPSQPTEKGKDVEHDQKPADWKRMFL